MVTEFVNRQVWRSLSAAPHKCHRRAYAAVAYFGSGASELLALSPGSRLVVDASERAVRTGQTCPKDLLRLVDRGVHVFSVPNLHAKVYVFGKKAYVGSPNASFHSRGNLVEALLLTTGERAVRAARSFVQSLCLQPLTPRVLRKLVALYRPPQNFGQRSKRTNRVPRPMISPVKLAQLELEDWSDADQAAHDAGLKQARKQRTRRASYLVDSFRWGGKKAPAFNRDDYVIQVTNEGKDRRMVSPPGRLLYVRRPRRGTSSFVYLELPANVQRRSLEVVAKKLGVRNSKRLRRGGLVTGELARNLLSLWNK